MGVARGALTLVAHFPGVVDPGDIPQVKVRGYLRVRDRPGCGEALELVDLLMGLFQLLLGMNLLCFLGQ